MPCKCDYRKNMSFNIGNCHIRILHNRPVITILLLQSKVVFVALAAGRILKNFELMTKSKNSKHQTLNCFKTRLEKKFRVEAHFRLGGSKEDFFPFQNDCQKN